MQELEQLKSEDIESGGRIRATFHTQPDGPLSKLPRCSGQPNMKTFNDKNWLPYQQDFEGCAQSTWLLEIVTGEMKFSSPRRISLMKY